MISGRSVKNALWAAILFLSCAIFYVLYSDRNSEDIRIKGTIYLDQQQDLHLPKVSPNFKIGSASTANVEVKGEILNLDVVNDDTKAKKMLEKMIKQGRTVLVSFVNDGYLPFANSWLCNTMYMGIHEQILLFATDNRSEEHLTRVWPRVNVINIADESLSGNQSFQRVGYLKLMVRRTECLQWLLQNNVEFMLFEFDMIWFSNPLPAVLDKAKDHDNVFIYDQKNYELCGCFMFMKTTDASKRFWSELTRYMRGILKRIQHLPNNASPKMWENDQLYLMKMIRQKYGGIKNAWMPFSQFPNGKWYNMTITQRKQFKPLIIHNNWVEGNQAKIKRAKAFKHWFWNSGNLTCDTNLVRRYTSKDFTYDMIAEMTPTP